MKYFPNDVSFIVSDRQIVLTPAQESTELKKVIQQQTVTGKVTDASTGDPMPGVNILISGTNSGTITDAAGNFSLEVPDTEAIIQFSFIGYITQNVPLAGQTKLNVSMTSDLLQLTEVVVVGYGTQKKETLSGAVGTIKSDDIVTTKVAGLAQVLQGKVAGLGIRQQTGVPGNFDSKISLRGFGEPVYVIDGVVRGDGYDFQRLNSEDIESISILKDGASAIYGMNAGNGVIIVTTKKGSGPVKITYNTTMGFSSPANSLLKMLNVPRYYEMYNEAYINVGRQPIFPEEGDGNYYELIKQKSYDRYNEVFKNSAFIQQHNISIQSGNDKISTYNSLGYNADGGIMRSGDMNYHQYTLVSNNDLKISKRLKANVVFSGLYSLKEQPSNNGDAYGWITALANAVRPYYPIYANDNPQYPDASNVYNPLAMSRKDLTGWHNWNTSMFKTTASLIYDIPYIEGLQFKILGAYDFTYRQEQGVNTAYDLYNYDSATDTYIPVRSLTLFEPGEYISQSNGNGHALDLQAQISYNTKIASNHNLAATLVAEKRSSKNDYVNLFRYYDLYTHPTINSASTTNQNMGGSISEMAFLSYIGRFNYDFKSKYLFEFAFREDASYRYSPEARWGFFPYVSAGWRVSEENFMKENVPVISMLKLRASYGISGNDAGDPNQYMEGYIPAKGYTFNSGGGLTNGYEQGPLVNNELTWYETNTTDFGLDFSVKNGLFNLILDFYRRDQTGLLAKRLETIPSTFGQSLPDENINSNRTQGFDFTIEHHGNIGEVKYGVSGNFNFSRFMNLYVERTAPLGSWSKYKSDSYNRYSDWSWGFDYDGQYQTEEEIREAPYILAGDDVSGFSYGNLYVLPGDYKYEDLNGDGEIGSEDYHPMYLEGNNGVPASSYGLTLNVSWKDFDFNMLWQGSAFFTGQLYEWTGMLFEGGDSNSPDFYYDRWHRADMWDPNSEWIAGKYPASRIFGPPYWHNWKQSPSIKKDASYVRLKSVEIGYTLPENLLKKYGVMNLRVFVNAYNLFTICDPMFKQFDPERILGLAGSGFSYPLSQSYNFGLNVSF